MKRIAWLGLICLLMVACGGETLDPTAVAEVTATIDAPAATDAPTDVPVPTATTMPTETSVPTATAMPTDTPMPTETAVPTATSRPTDTPTPTNTPLPIDTPLPTDTPEPTATAIPTKTPFPTDTPTPIMSPTPSPVPATATPSVFTLGSLADMPDDTRVTIAGDVVYTESFSKGFKFTVSDGTGRVVLLMWEDTYDTFAQRGTLNVGSSVVVEGRVGRFDGELQVTPWNADSVRLTKEAYPWGQPTQVDQLPGKLNQRVMVEGTVSRASSNQYGTEIIVDDGTGEVEVFVWSNIFSRMPNQSGLQTPGTAVRVVGNVGEYRGQYQILPVLPYDFVVR